jgi:hypothetical protein
MAFPQNTSGTINWFTVFTDPENGFIPLLMSADDSDKLRDCFELIINQLFSRKTDEEIRSKNMNLAEELFRNSEGKSNLSGQKTRLRVIMDRIMNERIMKANAYEELQKADCLPSGEKRTD